MSNIDDTKPTAINPTTASVRQNFAAAKSEINQLQHPAIARLGLTNNFTVAHGSAASKIAWGAYDYNPANVQIWSAANPSRLTIPAGYTACRLKTQVRLDDHIATQTDNLHCYKNNSIAYPGVSVTPFPTLTTTGASTTTTATPWLPVTEGDYFEILIINLHPDTDEHVLATVRTWIEIELRA
jgi:hypothetical protein